MIEAVKSNTLHVGNENKKVSTEDCGLRRVCAQFESLLIHYILKSGRNTLPGNDLFDKSHDSQIYKSMMDERLSISVSEGKGIGLGELLYEQLEKNRQNYSSVGNLSESR